MDYARNMIDTGIVAKNQNFVGLLQMLAPVWLFLLLNAMDHVQGIERAIEIGKISCKALKQSQ